MDLPPVVKLEIFIPADYLETLAEALHQAGAGKIGNYDHCMSIIDVTGTWRPLAEANPFLGEVGQICRGSELKIEVNCAVENVTAALSAIRRVHPYEEPVINIVPLLNHLF
ncbi:MAG: YqfO family protein [Anaerolineae bacterium]|nr:YqfO family protein [Anaerolineae bacterium]